MRHLATFVLILVFAASFAVLALLDALARTLADPDAVVEIAASAGVRATVVDASEEILYGAIVRDPELGGLSRPELHAIVDDIMADEWFASSLRRAHAALVQAVAETGDSAVLDLRPTKAELYASMRALEQRAEEICARLLGAAQCGDSRKSRELVDLYLLRSTQTIESIADELDLTAALAGELGQADRARLEEARRWIGRAGSVRGIGLAALLLCLGLITLCNWRPGHRLLVALGLALAVAGVAALVAYGPVERRARAELSHQITAAPAWRRADPIFQRTVPAAAGRLAGALVGNAASRARGWALGAAVAGAALLGAGLVQRRRAQKA